MVLCLALASGGSAVGTARAADSCVAPTGPVSLIILASGPKVLAYARTLTGTVVRSDAKTVIFDDGRVITADAAAAGTQLNELGWGSRRIVMVASFSGQRPRRARG